MGPTDTAFVEVEVLAAVAECGEAACTKLAESTAVRKKDRSKLDSILHSDQAREIAFCPDGGGRAQTLLQVVPDA